MHKPRKAVRPAESYVHGLDGPTVTVPARVAALLLRRTDLGAYARDHRGEDPETDQVLVALRLAAAAWLAAAGSDCGPSLVADGAVEASSARQLSTGHAAKLLGITERSVRRAVTQGRLRATPLGGRWVLTPEDVEHFRAQRAA